MEDKVWGKVEVKVKGEEWVEAAVRVLALAANAFVRSAGRERRINAAHPALNIPAPSAGQRWFVDKILVNKTNKGGSNARWR